MAIGILIIIGMILLLVSLITEEDMAYWFGVALIVIAIIAILSELALPPVVHF